MIQRPDPAPHLADARCADAQLVHAQSQQQRHRGGVGGSLAADFDHAALRVRGTHDLADGGQYARMVGG
jgi:hypothetical protein